MDTEVSRLRADARHNRDRILTIARELFAERGLDVPMTAVARRAGVGVATLYRRFPTRTALVNAVFADQFTACAATVADALDDPDPWRGLCAAIAKLCAAQAADRGFNAAFVAAEDPGTVTAERDRVMRGFADLVQRAKDSGHLRRDFTLDDLALVLMANSGVVAKSGDPAASRRLVAYLLSAFRADTAGTLPPSVPLDPLAAFRTR